jgi:hypothetical protein
MAGDFDRRSCPCRIRLMSGIIKKKVSVEVGQPKSVGASLKCQRQLRREGVLCNRHSYSDQELSRPVKSGGTCDRLTSAGTLSRRFPTSGGRSIQPQEARTCCRHPTSKRVCVSKGQRCRGIRRIPLRLRQGVVHRRATDESFVRTHRAGLTGAQGESQ